MDSFDSSQPPSSIERLLIFHRNLPEKCSGGKSLGENASVQEVSEQILYYHRNQQWAQNFPQGLPTPRTKSTLMDEAVHFLGLCSALFGLPGAFGTADSLEDHTQEIYFEKSTLVFVPLESSDDLLAVVQVSRQYQQGKKSETSGGNPLAVRNSIERTHKLFCMLRGGGVLKRISPSFGEMQELYNLLKQIRGLRDRDDSRHESGFDNEASLLEREVTKLRRKLPIQSLRRDLDAHYTEYLSNQAMATGRNGGSGRCIVECVPVPMSHHSFEQKYELFSKVEPSPLSSELAMRRLLDNFSTHSDQGLVILGASTFSDGCLRHTHLSVEALSSHFGGGAMPDSVNISNETVCLLSNYMMSFGARMSAGLPATTAAGQRSEGTSELRINTLAFSFRDATTSPTVANEGKDRTDSNQPNTEGTFLPPPPQSMLSASDSADFVLDSEGSKVWSVTVHMPFEITANDNVRTQDVEVIAVVFILGSHFFLIFFDKTLNIGEKQGLFQLRMGLAEIVRGSLGVDRDDIERRPSNLLEPGQDIIYIDRREQKIFLLHDESAEAAWETKPRTKSNTRRFLGFGRKHEKQQSESIGGSKHNDANWIAIGLDSRHQLASHLHLDTILAFDDTMNEVDRRRRSSKTMSASETLPSVEFCTCMPLGWVYAYAENEEELYIFIDSSIYVTVADVQSAAARVKSQVFKDSIGAQ